MIETLSLNPNTELVWQKSFQASSLQVPFLTYQWHTIYFSTDGKGEEPIILYIPEFNTIAPFGKKENIATFVGPEITDYSDIVGPEDTKREAWNVILEELAIKKINTISLTNIPETSATYTFFLERSQKEKNIVVKQRDTTPKINPLPSTYEEYLQNLSRKNRHELERKQRKFLREYEEICICTKIGKEAEIDTILSLMKLDERKLGFLTPEHESFFRSLPNAFPDSLVTMVLYVNKKPATAIVAFKTSERFLLYNSGFDQNHYSGGGFYLKAQSIHYAISNKLMEYNFLRGGERYKHNLGGIDFPVFDITISNLS